MSVSTLAVAVPSRNAVGSDLDHLYCCNSDLSLCGLDIADLDELEEFPEDDLCIVCRELEEKPCERCGQ